MSIGVGSYSGYQKPIAKWQFDGTKVPNTLRGTVTETQTQSYVSQYGNTCTDGADDGNIGFGDKLAGVGKGVVRSVTNVFKGIFSNPAKSAAIIGVCCIPVVGKFIGLGLAAYGLVKSGAQLFNNVQIASASTNDAQAKDAWENIGTSGFNAALSAVAIKGCVSGIKYDLTGGSPTANLARSLKAQGVSKAELYSRVAKSAVNETAANAMAIPKAAWQKVKNAGSKVSEFYRGLKDNGFSETVKATWDNSALKAKVTGLKEKFADGVSSKAEKIGEKMDEIEANKNMTPEEKAAAREAAKAEAKAQREAAKAEAQAKKETLKAKVEKAQAHVKEIKSQAQADGSMVQTRIDGSFKVTNKNGDVTYHNAIGDKVKTVQADGDILYYGSDGETVVRQFANVGNDEYAMYDVAKDDFISPEEVVGYNDKVQLGFGKLTRSVPITNKQAAQLTPYVIIGEQEQN